MTAISSSILWTPANQLIYVAIESLDLDNVETSLEKSHRVIHNLVSTRGPLNRYELAHLCLQELETKQDVQRIITDYKKRAIEESLLQVLSPKEFLAENTVEFTGVAFSERGGYTIIDEQGQENGNWRTADEAIEAHETDDRYSHIPQT